MKGKGDAGADRPGGATMATTSKFQPPGMGRHVEQRVPKLLSPSRAQKSQLSRPHPHPRFPMPRTRGRASTAGLVFPEARPCQSTVCPQKGPLPLGSPSRHLPTPGTSHTGHSAPISLDGLFGTGLLPDRDPQEGLLRRQLNKWRDQSQVFGLQSELLWRVCGEGGQLGEGY